MQKREVKQRKQGVDRIVEEQIPEDIKNVDSDLEKDKIQNYFISSMNQLFAYPIVKV